MSDSTPIRPTDQVVRVLQYEVREGREAGEVVVIPKAFIADRNSSFILLESEVRNGLSEPNSSRRANVR